MKTTIMLATRSLGRAICLALIVIAALWAMLGTTHAQLYVGQAGTDTIGEYDATTGAAINANLIARLYSTALALSGNDLFVANWSYGTVGEYDATNGSAVNTSFITGLIDPDGLALLGNKLFVADDGRVGEYDVTTGAAINASFITGPLATYIAASGNNLYVYDQHYGMVGDYDATTGAAINPDLIFTLIGAHCGLAVSGNDLFVSNPGNGTVGQYNATTGAAINASFITGLNDPEGLALLGNKLFVANNGSTVGEYDATTGAVINANLITGLQIPSAIAVAPVPEPSAWYMLAIGGVALLGIMLRKKHATVYGFPLK